MPATPATPNPDENIYRSSRRIDGWIGEKQAAYLEHIADGHTVEIACRMVGMSVASAYAFRRRAAGQAFALGRAARRQTRAHTSSWCQLRARSAHPAYAQTV